LAPDDLQPVSVTGYEGRDAAERQAASQLPVRRSHRGPTQYGGLDHAVVPALARGNDRVPVGEGPGRHRSRSEGPSEPVEFRHDRRRKEEPGAGHESVDFLLERKARPDDQEEYVGVQYDPGPEGGGGPMGDGA